MLYPKVPKKQTVLGVKDIETSINQHREQENIILDALSRMNTSTTTSIPTGKMETAVRIDFPH